MGLAFLGGGHSRRAAAMVLVAVSLGGCGVVSNNFGSVKCPTSDIAGPVASVTRVRGPGGNYADLAYKAQMSGLKGTCAIDDDGVTVALTVTVTAEIGPAAGDRTVNLPYFVAVVDPRNRVIAKQVLDNSLTFPANQQHVGATDTLTQRIPLKRPETTPDYHVFLGFQLTKEELEYNRVHTGS